MIVAPIVSHGIPKQTPLFLKIQPLFYKKFLLQEIITNISIKCNYDSRICLPSEILVFILLVYLKLIELNPVTDKKPLAELNLQGAHFRCYGIFVTIRSNSANTSPRVMGSSNRISSIRTPFAYTTTQHAFHSVCVSLAYSPHLSAGCPPTPAAGMQLFVRRRALH